MKFRRATRADLELLKIWDERPHVHAILLDPLYKNERARRFYERLGFEFVERRQFGRDDCAVYRLERSRWKNE